MASDCNESRGFTGLRIKPPPVFQKIPDFVTHFMHSISHNLAAPLATVSTKIKQQENNINPNPSILVPVLFNVMPVSTFTWLSSAPWDNISLKNSNNDENNNTRSSGSNGTSIQRVPPSRRRRKREGGFPSNVRIDGIDFGNNRGPAFLGQVFSLCNPYGTGLMAVTKRIELPFGLKTPEWMKKILALVTKNDMDGVFRFFLDIGDAVGYVNRLNIPSGLVGACRLDVAYKHFKDRPHMFQFIPNEKQVKEAKKLLREKSGLRRGKQLKGVPVFTAQNLSIAIASTNGVRWFTPYFFNKQLLDDILETSVDQHFESLIQNRYVQRRQEIGDDDFPTDLIDEHFESSSEPLEVDELLEELAQDGIPFSIISKAAEVHLYDVADRLILGNRWIRKATGIQPKFPFMVDSFEERAAVAVSRAMELSIGITPDVKGELGARSLEEKGANISSFGSEFEMEKASESGLSKSSQSSEKSGIILEERSSKSDSRVSALAGGSSEQSFSDHIQLPKITIVGISMSGREMNKVSMEKLTREIEESKRKRDFDEDTDPLFVANVGNFTDIVSSRTDLEERE
ncbi:hypothetical protein SUGI_0758850 [Cryptomeria japonica]|uniref:uncharacterized protein LOC131069234 n=1 Tax=Cryptomeria japonica TaxID=3369 RepID=UPI002414C0DF|nr:uncharacterized protein LOC131069234 [Cryptomeria japonica]GLJ37392.1 hypothetical protein SUGI_0758850 [Cryptomeria japonica]